MFVSCLPPRLLHCFVVVAAAASLWVLLYVLMPWKFKYSHWVFFCLPLNWARGHLQRVCKRSVCVSAQRCSSCSRYSCHRAEIRRWRPRRFLSYLKTSASTQQLSALAEGLVFYYTEIIYSPISGSSVDTHAFSLTPSQCCCDNEGSSIFFPCRVNMLLQLRVYS